MVPDDKPGYALRRGPCDWRVLLSESVQHNAPEIKLSNYAVLMKYELRFCHCISMFSETYFSVMYKKVCDQGGRRFCYLKTEPKPSPAKLTVLQPTSSTSGFKMTQLIWRSQVIKNGCPQTSGWCLGLISAQSVGLNVLLYDWMKVLLHIQPLSPVGGDSQTVTVLLFPGSKSWVSKWAYKLLSSSRGEAKGLF